MHNCFINNEKYDLVITPHGQSVGYIRTERQTLGEKNINKQKQIIRKRFSKRRKAVSKSETTAIQELHNIKESINKKTIKLTNKYIFLTQKPHHKHQ